MNTLGIGVMTVVLVMVQSGLSAQTTRPTTRPSTRPDGVRVLCIGGVPGGAYKPPEWSSSGEE